MTNEKTWDISISEIEIYPSGKMIVFRANQELERDSRKALDWAIQKYISPYQSEYIQLIESNLTNPWMVVLLEKDHNLPTETFNPYGHRVGYIVRNKHFGEPRSPRIGIQEGVYYGGNRTLEKIAIFNINLSWSLGMSPKYHLTGAISGYCVNVDDYTILCDKDSCDLSMNVVMCGIESLPIKSFDPEKHHISKFIFKTFKGDNLELRKSLEETHTFYKEGHLKKHYELLEIIKPVQAFLKKYFDPHAKMIVDDQSVEIIQGIEYFKNEGDKNENG